MSAQLEKVSIIPQEGPTSQLPAQSEVGALISIIERAARDPSVDIDKMQRLMDMQERIMIRNARAAYAAALSAMQPELPVITRKGKIEVRKKDAAGERTGAVQQSTPYALWEDINEGIRPVLAKHGFALSFRVGVAQDGKLTITGILSHREGHSEETTITLQHDSTGSKNAVQAVGSSVSYGKRYTAGALLNFTSRGEDTDGNVPDVPEDYVPPPGSITQEQADNIRDALEAKGASSNAFLQWAGQKRIESIPAEHYDACIEAIKKFKKA